MEDGTSTASTADKRIAADLVAAIIAKQPEFSSDWTSDELASFVSDLYASVLRRVSQDEQ